MKIQSTILMTGVAAFMLAAPLTSPVFAKQAPGNNGAIKIDGKPFNNGNGNEPHVNGDTFDVKLSGFDQTTQANVQFELKSPTKQGTLSVSGNTNPTISGNGQESYTLSVDGAEPQKNQGYHVKATVQTDSGVKHKVFWVKPCDKPAVSPTPTPVVKKTDKGQVSTVAASTSKPQAQSAVLAATTAAPTKELPNTGANPIVELIGFALLASGLILKKLA